MNLYHLLNQRAESGKQLRVGIIGAGKFGSMFLAQAQRTPGLHLTAVAKRDLKAGEILDGEGGYTVYGKLMPARDSLELGGLPIGLSHSVKLKKPVRAGTPVCWNDVEINLDNPEVRFRREMEKLFGMESRAASPAK